MALINSTVILGEVSAIPFQLLGEEELREILSWRNHKAVRLWMENKHIITWAEHLQFAKSLESSKSKLYFLVKEKENSLGVVNLSEIDGKSAQLGIYRNPCASMKGIGKRLMNIIEYISKKIQLKRLWLKVQKNNYPALSLYKRCNYKYAYSDMSYAYFEKEIYKLGI